MGRAITREPVGSGREAWHGTVNGYTNRRCGCSRCRGAWAKYRRDYNNGRKAENA